MQGRLLAPGGSGSQVPPLNCSASWQRLLRAQPCGCGGQVFLDNQPLAAAGATQRRLTAVAWVQHRQPQPVPRANRMRAPEPEPRAQLDSKRFAPPIVDSWYSKNCPLTKRSTNELFPTAESPRSTSLNWKTFGAAAIPQRHATNATNATNATTTHTGRGGGKNRSAKSHPGQRRSLRTTCAVSSGHQAPRIDLSTNTGGPPDHGLDLLLAACCCCCCCCGSRLSPGQDETEHEDAEGWAAPEQQSHDAVRVRGLLLLTTRNRSLLTCEPQTLGESRVPAAHLR